MNDKDLIVSQEYFEYVEAVALFFEALAKLRGLEYKLKIAEAALNLYLDSKVEKFYDEDILDKVHPIIDAKDEIAIFKEEKFKSRYADLAKKQTALIKANGMKNIPKELEFFLCSETYGSTFVP